MKDSDLLNDAKEIRYFGEVRNVENVLVCDSVNAHLDRGNIIFSAVRAAKIDSLKMKNLLTALIEYKKKLHFNSLEKNNNLFHIYFDLDRIEKSSLPKINGNELKNYNSAIEGDLAYNINDSSTTGKVRALELTEKISDNWYLRLRNE